MKKLILVAFVMLMCACSTNRVKTDLYENDADRYAKNILVKESSDDTIIYEYKDVRIDEIAGLAAKHCNKVGRRAVLQHTYLHKNNKMRATFVCTILQ